MSSEDVERRLQEVESIVLAREDRTPVVVLNLLKNGMGGLKDARCLASWQAAGLVVVSWLLPTNPTGAIVWSTAIALVISYYTYGTVVEQKKIENRAALFQQTQNIQLALLEHPELRRAFYGEKDLKLTSDDLVQLTVVTEMMADLLDHAAASQMEGRTDEAWGNYCRDTYKESPPFRKFLDAHRDWYPNVWRWLNSTPSDATDDAGKVARTGNY